MVLPAYGPQNTDDIPAGSGMMEEERNQREFVRACMNMAAMVVFHDTEKVRGKVKDVSLRGLLFLCEASLPVGCACDVTLFLGGDEVETDFRICARGKIVRQSGAEYGIEFMSVDVDSLGHLRNLVHLNVSDPRYAETEFKRHIGLKRKWYPHVNDP